MGEKALAQRAVAREVVKSYTYVVIWMSISIAVILFNKWLLAYSGFPYPIALTMWHMTFCSSIAFASVRVFGLVKSHNMTAREYCQRVMPIGERRGGPWAPPRPPWARHSLQEPQRSRAQAHSARLRARPCGCRGAAAAAVERPVNRGQSPRPLTPIPGRPAAAPARAQACCTPAACGCPTARTSTCRCRSFK
jgi:hypothetical protein